MRKDRLKSRGQALGLTVIASVLILFAMQEILGGVYWLLSDAGASLFILEVYEQLYMLAIYLAAFLAPYLVYAHVVGIRPKHVPHKRPYLPVTLGATGITLGLSVFALMAAVIVLTVCSIIGLTPPSYESSYSDNFFILIWSFLNSTVLPAVIEEISYRGIIMTSLRPYGDRFAIIVSALIFALMHGNIAQFVTTFIAGLAIGFFVVKTDSLYTGMFIHFVNNAIASLLGYAQYQATDTGAMLMEIGWMGMNLLFGVAALIYMLAVRRLNFSLADTKIPDSYQSPYARLFGSVPMVLMFILLVAVVFLSFFV